MHPVSDFGLVVPMVFKNGADLVTYMLPCLGAVSNSALQCILHTATFASPSIHFKHSSLDLIPLYQLILPIFKFSFGTGQIIKLREE